MRFYSMLTRDWVEASQWQADLKVGDYYKTVHYGIYGQILEATRDSGFFIVKAYSVACPEGERGMFCVMDATNQITQDEFEQAKQRGWREER
jgi:hypothetical protein